MSVLLPDVDVLVYAHRADEAHHGRYCDRVEALVSGRSPFALSLLVAAAFVRIVTNRRIYPDVTPLPVALGVVDALVAHPNCRLVRPAFQAKKPRNMLKSET